MDKKIKQFEGANWNPFRSLANYKRQHADAARKKGKLEQLIGAPTLTAARRIVFGR